MNRLPLLALLLAFGCKEITSFVVGNTVEAGKEMTKGVVEGVEEGRKQGESVDGATIVTRSEDLEANGSVSVREVTGGDADAHVVLAFENTTDKPLRLSNVEVLALDADGFTQRPVSTEFSLTVPPRAKDQLVVDFAVGTSKIHTVRVWGKDLVVPAPVAPATP